MWKVLAKLDFNEDLDITGENAENEIRKFCSESKNIEFIETDDFPKSIDGQSAQVNCIIGGSFDIEESPKTYVKSKFNELEKGKNALIHNVQVKRRS